MTITYTADVFCDGDSEGCRHWTHGVSGNKPPTKKQARAQYSEREGWKCIDGRDYCPSCVSKLNHRAAYGGV